MTDPAESDAGHRPLPRPTRADAYEADDLDAEAEAIVWGGATPEQRRQRYVEMWNSYLWLGGVLSSRDVPPGLQQEGDLAPADPDSPRGRVRLVRRFGI